MKGRLRENISFWEDFLEVLDWISKGLHAVLPPAYRHANQQSALEHKKFVSEAITDLLNNGCVQRVSSALTCVATISCL